MALRRDTSRHFWQAAHLCFEVTPSDLFTLSLKVAHGAGLKILLVRVGFPSHDRTRQPQSMYDARQCKDQPGSFLQSTVFCHCKLWQISALRQQWDDSCDTGVAV